VANRRRWCFLGPSELGLSINRARWSFLARIRRRRGSLASLATAGLSSGEVKAMVVAAEMPNVASSPLGWLREEVEKVGEVAVVLCAARFERRRDDDDALARRVCGSTSGLLLRLGEHSRGRRGGEWRGRDKLRASWPS
jgi:hypothetical protein